MTSKNTLIIFPVKQTTPWSWIADDVVPCWNLNPTGSYEGKIGWQALDKLFIYVSIYTRRGYTSSPALQVKPAQRRKGNINKHTTQRKQVFSRSLDVLRSFLEHTKAILGTQHALSDTTCCYVILHHGNKIMYYPALSEPVGY